MEECWLATQGPVWHVWWIILCFGVDFGAQGGPGRVGKISVRLRSCGGGSKSYGQQTGTKIQVRILGTNTWSLTPQTRVLNAIKTELTLPSLLLNREHTALLYQKSLGAIVLLFTGARYCGTLIKVLPPSPSRTLSEGKLQAELVKSFSILYRYFDLDLVLTPWNSLNKQERTYSLKNFHKTG